MASWGLKMGSWGLLGRLGGFLTRFFFHLGVILEASRKRLGGVFWRLLVMLVANLAPTWPPTWAPKRAKIEAKIDQFLYASWNRIFRDFGGFLRPKGRQVGRKLASKIEVNFEGRFFQKTSFFQWKNNDFQGSGGRS